MSANPSSMWIWWKWFPMLWLPLNTWTSCSPEEKVQTTIKLIIVITKRLVHVKPGQCLTRCIAICYECSDKLIIYQSGGFSYTWTLKNNKVAVWAFSKQMLIWIFLIILSKHFANISQKLFKLLAFQIMLTFYLLVLIGEQLLNIHNEGWLFSNKGCLGYSKKLANS